MDKFKFTGEGGLNASISMPYETGSVYRRGQRQVQRELYREIRERGVYQFVSEPKRNPAGGIEVDADGHVVTVDKVFASNDDEHAWTGEVLVEWLQDLHAGKGALLRRSKRSPVGFELKLRGFDVLSCAHRFCAMQRNDFHYWVPLEEQAKIFLALRLDTACSGCIWPQIERALAAIQSQLGSKKPDFWWLSLEAKRSLRRFLILVLLYQRRCQRMLEDPRVKAQLRVVYDGCEGNLTTARELVDTLFARQGRLLVLRVEFYFMASGDLGKTAESALHCRKKFFNNLRTTTLGKMLLGYIWVLEFASRTSYHFHLMLFVNGDVHERDGHWAQKFVDAWRKFFDPTQVWGNNCNRKNYKERSFLGIVHFADENKRRLLDENLQYLCKKRQFVSVKAFAKIKTFGTSRIDRSERKLKGRPRKSQSLKQADIVAATPVDPAVLHGDKPSWASQL